MGLAEPDADSGEEGVHMSVVDIEDELSDAEGDKETAHS